MSYDTDGNLKTLSGAGLPSGTFYWTTRDKLYRINSSGSRFYRYDYRGLRVVKEYAGVGTYYIFSGDTLIGEINGTTPTVAYTHGADGVISERDLSTSTSHWYHFGPQGETRELTDSSGTVAASYLYNAYGKLLTTVPTISNPFQYGGKFGYYTDDNPMGVILAQQRWYSPHIMRWLSRDPIEYDGGDNLYGYVLGNPVGYVDPDGKLPVRNNTGQPLPYKPESENNVVKICAPGEVCDMDGFYPIDLDRPPVQIHDYCLGTPTIEKDCSVSEGYCIPFITVEERSPEFFERWINWPNPYSGENGWPLVMPLREPR